MKELIIFLIKYTAIFACILYAYTRLLRIKLKVWDLFDIPLFAAFSTAIYFATLHVRILIPVGFLIFSCAFLYLRFRKTLYETVTVGTIALGISIISFACSHILGFTLATAFYIIKNELVKNIITQSSISTIQIACVFLLFKIKRLRSGVNPKGETATFEILLFFSVVCIFTMMLFYTKQSLYEIVLLAVGLCGLLLIVWWRRHITYNYREALKQQKVNNMKDTIENYELSSVENDYQVSVYNRTFHYLNKAVPDCALLAENAAEQTGCKEMYAVRDMLQSILREMDLANEKCSLENIPQTGDKLIDAVIIRMFNAAENKKLNVSAEISADVESWFSDGTLSKHDIHTLLTYLCDNAIISALGSPNAKVRLELSETNRKPIIRIYDSGEQFAEKVLARLGLEQITTRAGVGGNGIGLFKVFEILEKYGASFTLDEAPQNSVFTKFIEIAFDGRHSVTVRTCRESVVAVCAKRKEITVERIEGSEAEILRDGTNG